MVLQFVCHLQWLVFLASFTTILIFPHTFPFTSRAGVPSCPSPPPWHPLNTNLFCFYSTSPFLKFIFPFPPLSLLLPSSFHPPDPPLLLPPPSPPPPKSLVVILLVAIIHLCLVNITITTTKKYAGRCVGCLSHVTYLPLNSGITPWIEFFKIKRLRGNF